MGEHQPRSGKDQRSGVDRRKLKDSTYKGSERRRKVSTRRSRKDRRGSSL